MRVVVRLLILMLIAGNLWAQDLPKAPVFTPGREVAVKWPGLPKDIVIYVPSNYDAKRKWPCVFYYHGTNGLPRTDVIRRVTKGKDYVIVGMEYYIRGEVKLTPQKSAENRQRHYKTFCATRKWLAKHLKIDTKRIYISGASKGGWMTASMGELDLKNVAGLIILMGGRHYSMPPPKDPKLIKGKKVYFGVGEFDPNHISSLWGRDYYKKYGATVCFEVFKGLGHDLSTASGTLADWLEVEGRLKDKPDTMNDELQAWIDAKTKAIKEEGDLRKRYRMLSLLGENPKLALCSNDMRRELRSIWKKSTKPGTPGADEREAESTFRKLVTREYNWWRRQYSQSMTFAQFRDLVSQIRAINRDYGKLAKEHPKAGYVELAEKAQERTAEPMKSMNEKLKAIEEKRKNPPKTSGPKIKFGSGPTIRR